MKRLRAFAACIVLAAVAIPLEAKTPALRTEIPHAVQPQLTTGGDGRVWLVYGQAGEAPPPPAPPADGHKHKGHQPRTRAGDIFVAVSTDSGATFSPPLKIASLPKLMLGMRRGPRIAAHGHRLTVTAIADELIAFTSDDGGRTWSDALVVNEVPTSAREGLHDLAVAPDGGVFVTWLDLRNGKMELWGAASANGGRTWNKNELVYKSPDKSICECCHPSALFDAQGNLAVMWRNSIEGARDMWLATRPKGSAHFSSARKLGEGTWKLNACPMDGGRLIALGRGQFGAVWQRNGEVFITRAEGAETKLGKGKQPVAALLADGSPTIVWQQGTDLMLVPALPGAEPAKCASDARFPSLVALPGGKGMLLAYERGTKESPSVAVERW